MISFKKNFLFDFSISLALSKSFLMPLLLHTLSNELIPEIATSIGSGTSIVVNAAVSDKI